MTAEGDLHYGPFRIDRKNRALYKKQSEILLEPIPFNIFEFFVENLGQRFSTHALLDKFWPDAIVGPSSVTTAVYKIRRMLAGDRGLLEGKSKTGYRLKMYKGSRIDKDEPAEIVASSTLSARFDIFEGDLRKLRAPDPLAERRAGLRDNLVVGCAIETLVHSTINSQTPASECGWDPARVTIIDTGETLDSSPILLRLEGGLMPLGPNEANNVKFVLSECSNPFKDDEQNLKLRFRRTDWQTHKTVRNAPDGVEKNEVLALEFGSLDLERNRVPSSVGLHYILRFADDAILLMKRRPDIAHDANRWSISGEEQFEASDFLNSTLLRAFQRTLCEEVFGLLDRRPEGLQDRWDKFVARYVQSMRLWSLVFEERACVTSLLGFYQLGISVNEFAALRRELAQQCVGTRDYEGRVFWTTTAEIEQLLLWDHCRAWLLDGSEVATVESSMLGKTSRYRAFRAVRAIRGRLPVADPETFKHSSLAKYPFFGFDHAMTLVPCPDPERGWSIVSPQVNLIATAARFKFPKALQSAYLQYKKANYVKKKFADDRHLLMLTKNPRVFTDAPKLILEVKEVLFSELLFFREVQLRKVPNLLANTLDAVMYGKAISFPHGLNLQTVVVTRDDRLLITKRARSTEWYDGLWSCSIEENLSLDDFKDSRHGVQVIQHWVKRMLDQELGLGEDAFSPGNVRILSVFVESKLDDDNAVLNICLCALVILEIDYRQLGLVLHTVPRKDHEFSETASIDYGEIMRELVQHPTRKYHPTSRYRMALAWVQRYGEEEFSKKLRAALKSHGIHG